MAILLDNTGLSLNDVLLVPQYSSITSRFSGEIDISTELVFGLLLKYPIISSNMDRVTEAGMAKVMHKLGGAGIIHRYMTPEKQAQEILDSGVPNPIVCFGAVKGEFERFITIKSLLDKVGCANIDVAHGHSQVVIDQIKRVKNAFPDMPVIAGNISTAESAYDLAVAGADCLRVGVGSGGICSTRLNTGCGVPLFTSILEAKSVVKTFNRRVTLIVDGGMRNSGDVVKALAGGADAVMTGSLLAGTTEAPGDIRYAFDGKKYKEYRGMSSMESQVAWRGDYRSIEGISTEVLYKGSVENVLKELIAGILSGFSYCGATSIKELHKNAVFIRQSTLGARESYTHALLKD